MQDPVASWAVILGAVATLAIALLGLANVRIARKTLRLMKLREERLSPRLQTYLVDRYLKRLRERDSRLYALRLRIANPTEASNSITNASLRIDFTRNGGTSSNIIIGALVDVDQAMREQSSINPDDLIVVPRRIGAYDAVSGWLLFEIANQLLEGATIDNYEIILTDASDQTYSHEVLLISERP